METTMLHLLCEIETMGLDGRAVRECRPLSAQGQRQAATGAREDERRERGEERSEVRLREPREEAENGRSESSAEGGENELGLGCGGEPPPPP